MSKPTLTPERLAELLKRYPHEPNAVLAADFGITAKKAGVLAFNNGVKKLPTTLSHANGSVDSAAALVLKAAKARGAGGVNRHEAIADLPGCREHSICNALRLLTDRGALHRAGRPRSYRWFAELKHALAHNKANEATGAPVVRTAGVRGPAFSDAAAVVTANTRRTVCPPFAARAIATPASALFSTLKPGQYLDAEAKPWINAATSKGHHA